MSERLASLSAGRDQRPALRIVKPIASENQALREQVLGLAGASPGGPEVSDATDRELDRELARLERQEAKLKRVIELRARVAMLQVDSALFGEEADWLRVLLALVVERTRCPADRILRKDKHEDVSWARHLVCYLARTCTKLSSEKIGAALGGRDHGTVLHSVRCMQGRMDVDGKYKKLVNDLVAEAHTRLSPFKLQPGTPAS